MRPVPTTVAVVVVTALAARASVAQTSTCGSFSIQNLQNNEASISIDFDGQNFSGNTSSDVSTNLDLDDVPGSAALSSNVPSVAVAAWTSGSPTNEYTGFASGSTEVFLPTVLNTSAFGSSMQFGRFGVQNTSGPTTVTVTYTESGTLEAEGDGEATKTTEIFVCKVSGGTSQVIGVSTGIASIDSGGTQAFGSLGGSSCGATSCTLVGSVVLTPSATLSSGDEIIAVVTNSWTTAVDGTGRAAYTGSGNLEALPSDASTIYLPAIDRTEPGFCSGLPMSETTRVCLDVIFSEDQTPLVGPLRVVDETAEDGATGFDGAVVLSSVDAFGPTALVVERSGAGTNDYAATARQRVEMFAPLVSCDFAAGSQWTSAIQIQNAQGESVSVTVEYTSGHTITVPQPMSSELTVSTGFVVEDRSGGGSQLVASAAGDTTLGPAGAIATGLYDGNTTLLNDTLTANAGFNGGFVVSSDPKVLAVSVNASALGFGDPIRYEGLESHRLRLTTQHPTAVFVPVPEPATPALAAAALLAIACLARRRV